MITSGTCSSVTDEVTRLPDPNTALRTRRHKSSKKKLPKLLEACFIELKAPRPIKPFFEDEARFGRINNVSRCWLPADSRAVVGQQMVREYIYAYTAVCPETGENYSIIAPVTNTAVMNVFLKALSRAYSKYRIILCISPLNSWTKMLKQISHFLTSKFRKS